MYLFLFVHFLYNVKQKVFAFRKYSESVKTPFAFHDHASFPQYSQRALNVDLSTCFLQTCVNLTVCRADNEGYMLDPMPPVIV